MRVTEAHRKKNNSDFDTTRANRNLLQRNVKNRNGMTSDQVVLHSDSIIVVCLGIVCFADDWSEACFEE